MNKRIAILLSGGIDSTTVLSCINKLERPKDILTVRIKYPSKHNEIERNAAIQISQYYGVKHRVMDLTSLFENFSSDLLVMGDKIPVGHYGDGNMKKTVVPMRNLIFATAVAGFLLSIEDCVWELNIGAHAGDHTIYPDCRPTALSSLSHAISAGSDNKVLMSAPFIGLNKHEIIAVGLNHATPYHLTRTCYTSDQLACGKCGSCNERLEAFASNGVSDPIKYSVTSSGI